MTSISIFTSADGTQYIINLLGIIFLLAILVTNLISFDLMKKNRKNKKTIIFWQIILTLIFLILILFFGIVMRFTPAV